MRWPCGRDLVEQLGDLGQEAQVGHLVGLVEDGDAHVFEGAGAAVDDVAQAARSGDEDVDAALQGVDLVAHRRTAADDLHLQAEDVAVGLQGVRHLHRELAGRGEDDAAGALLLGAAAGQRREQRQTEGEGLAGAGAATAEDVLAARASGMVAAWIGKGAVTPFCASLRTMPSGRPRDAKVTSGAASVVASTAVSTSSVPSFSGMTM